MKGKIKSENLLVQVAIIPQIIFQPNGTSQKSTFTCISMRLIHINYF